MYITRGHTLNYGFKFCSDLFNKSADRCEFKYICCEPIKSKLHVTDTYYHQYNESPHFSVFNKVKNLDLTL
jgi:hypothetical protein